MTKESSKKHPANAIEAQGLLIKGIYNKFGKDALPIIEEALGVQGSALGLKAKKKLPNNKLSTIANAFTRNWDSKLVKVISISDNKFHIQGTKCPFGLENTSRELCEAVMAIDREYFFTATTGKTRVEILKTVAGGDPFCDTIYTIEEPKE